MDKNGFVITDRDRVLRAWQNSTELVRDYRTYVNEVNDKEKLSKLFGGFAENEAVHAAKLLEILRSYDA